MEQTSEKMLSDQRIQASILAGPEKKLLLWIAPRLPRWMTPDLLTIIGLFGLIGCGISYYFARVHWGFLVLASLGHVINWFGDSLDGTLARVRCCQRPKYGYYLDHLIDAVGTSFLMFGLAYSGLITPIFAWIVLTLFLIASINAYLATSTTHVFQISYLEVSATEGRVLMIIANTILIFGKEVTLFGYTTLWLNYVAIAGSLLLLAIIISSASGNLLALDREERAKWS